MGAAGPGSRGSARHRRVCVYSEVQGPYYSSRLGLQEKRASTGSRDKLRHSGATSPGVNPPKS